MADRWISPVLERYGQVADWLMVTADGRIEARTGKVEIGQGIRTALTAIVAEELAVPFDHVTLATARSGVTPNEGVTAGSRSIEDSGGALRLAAATARELLVARAAVVLDAPAEQLVVEDGVVCDAKTGSNRSVGYGELLDEVLLDAPIRTDVPCRGVSDYLVVGTELRRVDLPGKVFGERVYVHDLALPDMLHARVVRPAQPGAELVDAPSDFDAPGLVSVVCDGSFVAVVCEHEWQAVDAARSLERKVSWADRPIDSAPVFERLRRDVAVSLLVEEGVPGDTPVPPAPDDPDLVRASYARPYQMHASIGPSAAAARFDTNRLTLWTHSQGPELLRRTVAAVLALDPANVEVIHVEGAGCYGHNGADDAALDAALAARAVPGRPVLVQWTRADEHRYEPYAPPMVIDVTARLEGGRVTFWRSDVISYTHVARPFPAGDTSGLLAAWQLSAPWARTEVGPSRAYHGGIHRNADPLYSFAERQIVKHFATGSRFRTSAMRSLGAFANVFAIESFMDELAERAGVDPFEFRLRHLDDPRARAVLARLRETVGRVGEDTPFSGTGIGFARYKNAQTYCGIHVALHVEPEPVRVRLDHVIIVADAGIPIDPDGLINQLEGGAVQAASLTLKEAVDFDQSGLRDPGWGGYALLAFDEVPTFETVLLRAAADGIDGVDARPLGAGEAAAGPMAAAIGNALAAAIGTRLRELPLTDRLVVAALAAGE